ncbi:MAG: DegT/DnrJ/EryC1/StrS family aminotransferase, partial [Anaerovoracaceae bacterium]
MQFIDLGKQFNIIEAGIRRGVDKVYEHKKFIGGPEVTQLEEALSDYVGVKHTISCANGTDALVLAILGLNELNVQKGHSTKSMSKKAYFVPSFSFFASAEAISRAGAIPVFIDCDEETFNIDINSLEKAIKETIQSTDLIPVGIVAVDLFGQAADYYEIKKIADKYKLKIIEDSAQGIGGKIKSSMSGSFGDVATTSFFPAKPLGCYGDGGAIFTDNDELAFIIRSLASHGQGSDRYDNVRVGMNSRLDTIQAVILLEKVKILENEIILRNQIADEYSNLLKAAEYINTPYIKSGYRSAWAQYTIKVDSGKKVEINQKSHRDILKSGLHDKDIPSMIYYPIPIHRSKAYNNDNAIITELPITDHLSKIVLS